MGRLVDVSDAMSDQTRVRLLMYLAVPVGVPIFIVGFVTIAIAYELMGLPEAAERFFPYVTVGGASVLTFLILVAIYRRLPGSARRIVRGPRR